MIDVSTKFQTLRYAKAQGVIYASPGTIKKIAEKQIPKGDVVEVARSAGIMAAKRTSDWIVFCHPIPLDWVEISISLESDSVKVIAEVKSIWKTGVEMEALSGVTGALLNIYDMLKPLDDSLRIGEVDLVKKKGGKSDYTDTFTQKLTSAVLVISDSTFAGTRKDKSGKLVREFLQQHDVDVVVYEILPDEKEQISKRFIELIDREGIDLVFATGGTGLGPRDVTPEATSAVIEKQIPGISEAVRRYGKDRTPYAMLSREICGVRKKSIIINIPGSSRGAKESMESLFPGLLHAFPMLWGGGHEKHSGGHEKQK